MKYGLIAAFAMALAGVATAQNDLPPGVSRGGEQIGASPPSTAEDTTTPDNSRYMAHPELLPRVQARLSAIQGKPCDLIFIGDSITEGWLGPGKAIWDKNYVPLHALNFGLGGDTTQNVLWRLNNMEVQELKPKVAVILIGTNNTGDDPHRIADGVKAVVSNTQEIFAGVKIILVSILPNARANEKMMAADGLIKHIADDSSVYYLNLVPLMPLFPTTNASGQTSSNWKGLGSDALHPDASGYQIWANAMDPLLKKLLAGG